jgi:hypothetical protein
MRTLAVAAPLDPVAGRRPALPVTTSVVFVFSVLKTLRPLLSL